MEISQTDPRPTFKQFLLAFLVTFLLWLLLVGTLHPQEVAAGALVALVASLAAWPRLGVLTGLRLGPTALVSMALYLAVFLRELVKANLQMARLVLSPALPIRPAVVAVRTSLTSPLGRMLLANSITLTPGTLSVEVEGNRILVHWVDCPPGTDLEAATAAIAAAFEKPIRGFLS